MFDRKLTFCLMKKGIHIMNPKKQKKVYVTVILVLYSIFNITHVESPKYKIICLKSPNSSEIAKKNEQWSKILSYVYFTILTTIQLNFKNCEIKK